MRRRSESEPAQHIYCQERKEPPKCANCNGPHTANYRGCPQFPKLKKTAALKTTAPAKVVAPKAAAPQKAAAPKTAAPKKAAAPKPTAAPKVVAPKANPNATKGKGGVDESLMGANQLIQNSFQVAFWNANGLRAARNELEEFVDRLQLDIVLVCETKLQPQTTDPKIRDFTLHRADRGIGPGGGTAIFVSNRIKHSVLATPDLRNMEAVGINVATANGPLRLFACYNRPQIPILEEDLQTLFDGNTPTIAAGDFNAKHINWGSRRSNRNGNILNGFTDQHLDISVMAPVEPTFYRNSDGTADILDVAIVKNVVHQVRLTAINDLSSDHNPVLMQIGNEANDPIHLVNNFGTIPPIRSTKEIDEDRAEANRLRWEVRKALSDFRNERWEAKLQSLTTEDNSVWRMSRVLRSDRKPLPPIHSENGIVFTDEEKAEAFALSMSRQCSLNLTNADLDHVEEIEDHVESIATEDPDEPLTPTTPEEVSGVIRKLKKRKASGPDEISNRALKNLPLKVIVELTGILNAMLSFRYFPQRWKMATVIFIPKPGKDPKFPQNHRPISLLSAVGKVAKRLIRSRLLQLTQERHIVPDEQFGFRSNHSTTDQLLRVVEHASISIERKQVTGAVFLDVAKAFDAVWHDRLIYKLHQTGIPLAMVQMIRSFLDGRRFQVRINNSVSDPQDLEAGVPQGSVLSPLLYSIFTHDIPKTDRTTLAIYADDTAILTRSKQPYMATRYLQESVERIENWCRRVSSDGFVRMFNADIPWSDQVKYLGVILDKKLSFGPHLDYALAKGKMATGMLRSIVSPLSIQRPVVWSQQPIASTGEDADDGGILP
ncbi:putative RNA-directed DNA polymerase from transposon X-element-like Protein [Tribolium castaneum]|uniref:Putative RNA-directed DNA polymerase from transposon X-element-like Protein n=1 Tax=Tribolium castaneum TaxID=7070 RepID=D7EM17_TRICA|nr:putative RNA-directed DNA polymerase from transposon X-element-like Protein [Tribolium castaneum]